MFILVNLKAYDADAIAIAEAAATVDESTDGRIAIAPQTASIDAVSSIAPETWAQHVSPVDHGSHTGSSLAEAAANAGATGTILNHSEHRLTLDAIESSIHAAQRAGLESVVCANSPDQIAAVTALGPDMVAVEPPELIGSGTPVSQADPEIVRRAVDAAASVDDSVPVLCGAGISKGEDVAAARDLGASGVLLASGVAKATDPASVLSDLVSPID